MSNPAAQIQIPFPPSVNAYWTSGIIYPRAWAPFVRRLVSEKFWEKAKKRFRWRGNWPKLQVFVGSRGKVYRQQVLEVVKELRLDQATRARLKVEIKAYMPDKRVHDLDNLSKAPLDALTFAGVWADDEQIDDLRWIRGPVRPPGCLIVRIEKLPVPIQVDLF